MTTGHSKLGRLESLKERAAPLERQSVEEWVALSREQRLIDVNIILASRGLKLYKTLGKVEKGEVEFIAILEIRDVIGKYYTDIHFLTLEPKRGDSGGWVVSHQGYFQPRFSANGEVSDGYVFTTMINGKIVLLREFRPTLMEWVRGCPRGFSPAADAIIDGTRGPTGVSLKDIAGPYTTLHRELSGNVLDSCRILEFARLGHFYTNSGTDYLAPEHFFVEIEVSEEVLRQRTQRGHNMSLKLVDPSKALAEIGMRDGIQGNLRCAHTALGILLAKEHLQRTRAVF